MQSSESANNKIKDGWRIYTLTGIFILGSIIQWTFLVNFESFEFLMDKPLFVGAFLLFIFAIIVIFIADWTDKSLPSSAEWIFAGLIVEILIIFLSIAVYNADNILLWTSLLVIIMIMNLMLFVGGKVSWNDWPNAVYRLNMYLLILILILFIISKVYMDIFITSLFIVSLVIALPALILDTLYVSWLIRNDSYNTKSFTDCLRPALYIYALFGAFLWLTLTLGTYLRD